jgi:serine/threonine protein kinase
VVSRDDLTQSGAFKAFEQELRVHELLSHPNIVRIHEIIFRKDLIYVFMDLCTKGDLLNFVIDHTGPIMQVFRPIIFQILQAVQYLHARGIAHRDLKPDNVLLTSNLVAKLADFGCCEVQSLAREGRASGTLYYAAPEVFLAPETAGTKADIWSFGIMLFTIFSGHLPFMAGDNQFLFDQITQRKFASMDLIPPDVLAVFDQCTALDPSERPTADELLAMPWISGSAQRPRGRDVIPSGKTAVIPRLGQSRSMNRLKVNTTVRSGSVRPVRAAGVRGAQSGPTVKIRPTPSLGGL